MATIWARQTPGSYASVYLAGNLYKQWYCYHGDGSGGGGGDGGGSGGGVDFGDDCRRVCLIVTCIPFPLAYNTSAADDAKCGITIPYNPTIILILSVVSLSPTIPQ